MVRRAATQRPAGATGRNKMKYKLVPVEPTDEMIEAMCDTASAYRVDMLRAYEEALHVAPQPRAEPVASLMTNIQSGDVEVVWSDDGFNRELWHEAPLYTHAPDDTALLRQALYALEHPNAGLLPHKGEWHSIQGIAIAALRERLGETK